MYRYVVLNSDTRTHTRTYGTKEQCDQVYVLGALSEPLGQKILFAVFLMIYMVTMTGNLLNVVTVVLSPVLNGPMFFFLGYLLFSHPTFNDSLTS